MKHETDITSDTGLGHVLSAAGPRERVSAEMRDRVRTNVRAAWAERHPGRRSWPRLAVAAVLFIAVAAGAFVGLRRTVAPAQEVGIIGLAAGNVEADRAQVSATTKVLTRERITTGAASGASITLADGGSLRIAENTELSFTTSSEVLLERGAVYFDSMQRSHVTVVTRHGSVRDIGTQFEVRSNERELLVSVREGIVELRRGGGEIDRATEGTRLSVAGGAVRRSTVAADDSAWDWAIALAPAFRLEGSTLAAFLEWQERELGVEMQLRATGVDPSSVRLHGTIEGLTPPEALHAVLATAGMKARTERDRIVIEELR